MKITKIIVILFAIIFLMVLGGVATVASILIIDNQINQQDTVKETTKTSIQTSESTINYEKSEDLPPFEYIDLNAYYNPPQYEITDYNNKNQVSIYHYQMAMVYASRNNFEMAIQETKKSIEAKPTYMAYCIQAECYYMLKKYTAAQMSLDEIKKGNNFYEYEDYYNRMSKAIKEKQDLN
ncbi:tetratricopeptide repeat protein [Methanococcus maripaludis]|uniref:Uncharacterized protein n=1 Tax=Methanococcus maripaludis OS7 TaxID=637915 RepID=A0A2Z5PHJ4_METMI|nr:hypothetical protein [Methanococcus maripaludis]BAP62113.1 hypothetical protein MMOS7_00270 [Methanococcus maripaludis OS7]